MESDLAQGRCFCVGVLRRVVWEFLRAGCFSSSVFDGGEIQISDSNEIAVFNIVKLFLQPGEPGGKTVDVHTYLWLHWPWAMCWTLTVPEASVLLTMASDIHPPLSNTHRHSQRERKKEREGEGEMHPTLELVYTQRICNYSVCLKCPKFLCKMEHLNRHHASAPATNCSAHQPQTEFVKFIGIRLAVCFFSIHSF